MKKYNALFASITGLLLLAASGASHAESVVRIGLGSDPDMLDPHTARTYYGRFVFNALCERLVDVDQKLNIVPGLATAWKYSEDGKTLTFTLREGVVFHDGETFDANAVKFNLERALTLPPAAASPESLSRATSGGLF